MCDLFGFVWLIRSVDEHGKFIASESSECILVFQTAADSAAYLDDQLIAERVPEGIVYEFKTIQVDVNE